MIPTKLIDVDADEAATEARVRFRGVIRSLAGRMAAGDASLVEWGMGRAARLYITHSMLSPSARIVRLLAGISAVWCLGCSSFDVLIDRIAGGEGGGAMSCMTAIGTNTSAGPSVGAIAYHAPGCGCDHCVAIQNRPTPIAPVVPPVPQTIVRIVESPQSIVREIGRAHV